jgi:hypothetical protein
MDSKKSIVRTLAIVACAVAAIPFATGHGEDEDSSIFGATIPPGYREWKLISVAHKAGNLNDLRAILGNKERFRSRTARSSPDWLGVTSLRRKTIKSLAVLNLSWTDRLRTGFNL